MKQYKLVITTYAENPQYAAQYEVYIASERERRGPYRQYDSPSTAEPLMWQEERSLEVTLTEAEFAAIKKAAVESFK